MRRQRSEWFCVPVMLVTADEYEVTVGYFKSQIECCSFLGCDPGALCNCVKHGGKISVNGQRKIWYRVKKISKKAYEKAIKD